MRMAILTIALMLVATAPVAGKDRKLPRHVTPVEAFDAAALSQFQLEQICLDYHLFQSQKRMVDEGKKPKSYQRWSYLKPKAFEIMESVMMEKGITLRELVSIRKREFYIGMSKPALLAAMGLPDRSNRTVGAAGEFLQYVYGRSYVYVTNGVITSWQD